MMPGSGDKCVISSMCCQPSYLPHVYMVQLDPALPIWSWHNIFRGLSSYNALHTLMADMHLKHQQEAFHVHMAMPGFVSLVPSMAADLLQR